MKLTLLVFLLIALTASATSQSGDILIWKGDTVRLFSNPLELRPDWEKLHKSIIVELEKEDERLYPQKYKGEVEELGSTACWRGYTVEWKIVDDKIYLNNIYACYDRKVKINLKKLFFKEFSFDLLFANWISGKLFIPKGKCIYWQNFGYDSIFENEIVLEFENGILKETTAYSNFIKKSSKFTLDPTLDYLDFINRNINWDKLPDLKNEHYQVFVGIQPNYEGAIDSIIWKDTYMVYGAKLITDRYNVFIKEAVRIAKLMPDWDVIYQRGSIVARCISVVFNKYRIKKYEHTKKEE